MSDLLLKSKSCYYLKKYLLLFIYHVYLDTEKEFKEELSYVTQIADVKFLFTFKPLR